MRLSSTSKLASHSGTDVRLHRLLSAVVLVLPALALLYNARTVSPAVPSTNVVISQVYGGGGNSGATYKNDFIELYNFGNSTINLTGWSVQYASASGAAWLVTNLSGSIAPGHYYLIQQAAGSGGASNLPAPDAVGGVSMSSTSAKVALVNSTAPLSGACPASSSIVDLVGYGTANCFEGSRAPATNNMNAVFRRGSGCTDTDNNANDFVIGLANPRNSASQYVCGAATPTPSPTPPPPPACGVERWPVKTGTDLDAGAVNLGSSTLTTVTTMRGWPAPGSIPSNNRISPFETTQWVVYGTLTKFKLEDDSDYHLVISDESGNTFVAEIALPACVGAGSPFAAAIANARAQFDDNFTATTSFQNTSVPVKIMGVGMFDFIHGQTGVAPNGIEIHPILDISFPGTPQLLLYESLPAPNEVAAIDPTLMRDPFDLLNNLDWLNAGADRNRRVILFLTNIQLMNGELPSTFVVNLQDSTGRLYDVAAEDVRAVPGFDLVQVMFRLPDGIASGSCSVTLRVHAQTTNSGVIRIR